MALVEFVSLFGFGALCHADPLSGNGKWILKDTLKGLAAKATWQSPKVLPDRVLNIQKLFLDISNNKVHTTYLKTLFFTPKYLLPLREIADA